MSRTTRRVTIKSIAHQAGVSLTTVSRALNDRPDIDPATQARILSIARSLGYSPSSLARSLATQHTYTLGLAVRTIADMWVVEIVPAIEELARTAGYEVFLSTHYADATQERHVLETFHSRQVDGILVISSTLGAEISTLQAAWDVPIVLISPLLDTPHRYVVQVDEVGGVQTATEYLLRLGHRRIAHIGVPTWTRAGRDRLEGYRRAMKQHGLAWDPSLVAVADAQAQGGLEAARSLLNRPDPPTAICCFNDLTAVGALRAARSSGLRVPQDLSIVGFDDVPLAQYVDPQLSTMRQDMAMLGRRATQMLLDLMAGQEVDGPLDMTAELVERGSCAAPRDR